MNLSYNIPHLLSEVNTATKAFLDDNSDHVDNQNRRKAIGAVDLLRTALTSPEERILHHSSDVS